MLLVQCLLAVAQRVAVLDVVVNQRGLVKTLHGNRDLAHIVRQGRDSLARERLVRRDRGPTPTADDVTNHCRRRDVQQPGSQPERNHDEQEPRQRVREGEQSHARCADRTTAEHDRLAAHPVG